MNEATLAQLALNIGRECARARNAYVDVQDDLPEGWNVSNTLAFVGLRALSPVPRIKNIPPTEEEAKELFDALPTLEASVVLPLYSFVHANKLFTAMLVTTAAKSKAEVPFSAFLSLTSYLTHHAHRSHRCAHYALLNLLSLQALVEDLVLVTRICAGGTKMSVRLCRQRPPHLPLLRSERVPASAILDICTDAFSHNLRRRLDVALFSLALGIMLRILSYLGQAKARLQHHWSYVWGTLLSLLKFLTRYATDLVSTPNVKLGVCTPLTDLIAFCLTVGDRFLPDPASYDDLFYKLVETGPTLTQFRNAYFPSSGEAESRSVDLLISVSTHYHDLLQAHHGGSKVHQSPAAVQTVIKEGYETLHIDLGQPVAQWAPWRESRWKAELKRITRTVVEDARKIAERS